VVRSAAISSYHVQRERRAAGTRDYQAQKVSLDSNQRDGSDYGSAMQSRLSSCVAPFLGAV